ncbi:hypothetical protein ACTHOQ_15440 [Solibacillus silvestris]|uniref:hypothetical protein n=1 Tax=Solibacillus silvestris TaxID=76853 RepID=UPI003F8142C9
MPLLQARSVLTLMPIVQLAWLTVCLNASDYFRNAKTKEMSIMEEVSEKIQPLLFIYAMLII